MASKSRRKSGKGRKRGSQKPSAAANAATANGSPQESPPVKQAAAAARRPRPAQSGGAAAHGVDVRALLNDASIPYCWAFGIFFGLTAIVAPYGQTVNGFNPDLHMAGYLQVGGLAFILVYLFHYLQRGHNALYMPRTPMIWVVFALYLWMLISLLWAHNFYEAWVKILDWGAALCIFVLSLLLIRDSRTFFPVLLCFYLGGLAVSLLGVGQYLLAVDWVQQHQAPAATFGNKNMAGEYLVLVAPLGACFLLNTRHRIAPWLYAFSGSFIIAYLFYGRTRASWVSFIAEVVLLAGFFIYFRFRHGYRPHWDRNKTFAFVASFVFLFALVNMHPGMLSDGTLGIDARVNPSAGTTKAESFAGTIKSALGGFEHSRNQRYTMWLNSLAMFRDHWFLGTGIGNWMVYYPAYQIAVEVDHMLTANLYHINAHNDYVEFLCELGLVGAVMMLMLIFIILRTIGRVASSRGISDENRMFGIAAAISILGISANAAFSFPLQQPVTIAMFLFYLALIVVVSNTLNDEDRDMYALRMPAQIYRISFIAVVGVAVAFLSFMHYQWYKSEAHYRVASASMSLGRYKAMDQYGRLAFERNPMRTYLHIFPATYYAKQSNYTKAIHHFEKLRDDYPWRIEIMQNLGASYLYSGRFARAREVFNLWDSLQPHSRALLKAHGMMLAQVGDRQGAIERLTRAREKFEEAVEEARLGGDEKKARRRQLKLDQINQVLASLGYRPDAAKPAPAKQPSG